MNQPKLLKFEKFYPELEIFKEIKESRQGKYLVNYLKDLGAKTLLIEPNYFDRDYLSEFSAFYSTSTRGYKNICQRIHFFSSEKINKEFFLQCANSHKNSLNAINQSYLGFCVLRPIKARLGRTVLKWYEDKEPSNKRIKTKRTYECHVAGVKLKIEGLAWQQQDTGVGACATIALWSALQSSAFDDFHTIPTTAEITKAANKTASSGERIFPSKGLFDFQLFEAIKELNLSPMIQNPNKYFKKDQFISSISSYIRSGYPVILLGVLKYEDKTIAPHAICITGFRAKNPKITQNDTSFVFMDYANEILYAHDDNIGANTRFRIIEEQMKNNVPSPALLLEAPDYSKLKFNNYKIIPETLVVAVHNELRSSPDQLYRKGIEIMNLFTHLRPLVLGVRFIKLTDYIHNELERLGLEDQENLGQLRVDLSEKAGPMSLHLGLIRVGSPFSPLPLVDILYDTTDSYLQAFAYIPFQKRMKETIQMVKKTDLGICISLKNPI